MVSTKYVAASYDPRANTQITVDKYKSMVNSDLSSLPILNELKQVPDIEGLCIGLMTKETSLIPYSISPWDEKWILDTYIPSSSSAKRIYTKLSNNYLDIFNHEFIWEIILPHGLGQVMGWNFCQDLSGDFCKDFLEVPLVGGGSFVCSSKSPKGTINNMFNGTNGEANQVRAMLVMLNSKYKASRKRGSGSIEAINSAIKSYLGTGKDAFGTTPEIYLASIKSLSQPPYKAGKPTTSSYTQVAKTDSKDIYISKPCALS